MSESLAGTVAIVTGASSGIGEATARTLAGSGASVVLAARRRDRLEQLAAELEGSAGTVLTVETDVADEQQCQQLVDRTVEELGRLDTVVNNAGVMLLGPIEDAPTDEWRTMVEVNVLGLMYVTRAALPHLVSAAEDGPRRVADIVQVSSVAGRRARAFTGVYNATKFAVGAFSEALRQEVTERHVRVSLVEPGAVDTELVSHNRDGVREQISAQFADLERLQSQDIADAVATIVRSPRHVAINELTVRPTEQRN